MDKVALFMAHILASGHFYAGKDFWERIGRCIALVRLFLRE